MKVLRRLTRVAATSVVGGVLVVAGAVMLLTPGPGLLAVAAGLAVLAREFDWAQRLLRHVRDRVTERFGRDHTATARDLPGQRVAGPSTDPANRRAA